MPAVDFPSPAADAHEERARAFIRQVDAALLRVARDPQAVFHERDELVGDLRRVLADGAYLAKQAERADCRRRIDDLLR